MHTHLRGSKLAGWTGVLLLVGAGLAQTSCGLGGVDIPAVAGPSERNISLMVMANPDIVPANGISTSAIGIIVRDLHNRPIVNLQVYMQLQGYGRLDRSYIVTDAEGMGSVTYTSPVGIYGAVVVYAFPLGLDSHGENNRYVTLDLVPPTP
jgi:hypothetical protein